MSLLKMPLIALFALVVGSHAVHAEEGASASSSHKTNLRFAPVSLLVGAISVNADFKINDQWTLGPELLYWSFDFDSSSYQNDIEVKSWFIGARGNWFPKGVYNDGLYVGPSFGFMSAEASVTDSNGRNVSAKKSAPYIGGLVGYGWFWDSFNMMLGGGLSVGLGKTDIVVTSSDGSTRAETKSRRSNLSIEYTLGWTF